jgi:predicted Fe-Mo cluster-binding NifX family protein
MGYIFVLANRKLLTEASGCPEFAAMTSHTMIKNAQIKTIILAALSQSMMSPFKKSGG